MGRLRSSRLLFVLALALLACARPPPRKKVVLDEPPDPTSKLKKLLKDVYSALEQQEPDRIEQFLTPDVVAFGLGPSDFYSQAPKLLERLRQEMIPLGLRGDQLKVISSQPRIGLAEGGKSAWLHDLPRFERVREGRASQYWSPRLTAHLIAEGESWKIDALHVSLGYPDSELYAPNSDRRLIPPEDPGVVKGRDSDELVGLTRRMLDDIAVKLERVSDREEVCLLGTDTADAFEGGKAFKELVRPQLAQLKKSNPFVYKIDGGPRSKLAPGGKSGWVAANVALRIGEGKKVRSLTPFRALWIFTEEKGLWNLVSDHQSLGLKPEQRIVTDKADLPSVPDGGKSAPDAGKSASDAGTAD
jgi:hypothetical protein